MLFGFLVPEIRAENQLERRGVLAFLNLGPPFKSREETHPFSLEFLREGTPSSPSLLSCLRFDEL